MKLIKKISTEQKCDANSIDDGLSETIIFGTKAETLIDLKEKATSFEVLPIRIINSSDWYLNPQSCLEKFCADRKFKFPLIVRSSCSAEDLSSASRAGEFASILNVESEDMLFNAIEAVFKSYGESHLDEHILIQPMARDVKVSGVVMTADAQTGAPYVIINYSVGANTQTVTSGEQFTKSFVFIGGHVDNLPVLLQPIIPVLLEIKELTNNKPVDIEFSISTDALVTVFQIRPIVMRNNMCQNDIDSFLGTVKSVQKTLEEIISYNERQGVSGSIFGVMPDWNPAELIGIKPRPLAYSLYRYLITDQSWAQARTALGYCDLSHTPLMHLFGGTPYVSVATSINSFIPQDVPVCIREKIIEDACSNLAASPHYHDKIEFTIMPTCFTPKLLNPLWQERFPSLSNSEWKKYIQSLLNLTNKMVSGDGSFHNLISRLEKVEILASLETNIESCNFLDCKTLLTKVRTTAIPLFSGVARAAFVATDIMKTLVDLGCMDENALEFISKSSSTIGSQMVADYKTLSKNEFIKRYGHIRPGTFDITVLRYDHPRATYFDSLHDGNSPNQAQEIFYIDENQINTIFNSSGLSFSWEEFKLFAINAIYSREYVKFLYSKAISDSLEIICNIGKKYGYDREVMSFVTLSDIENIIHFNVGIGETINSVAELNKSMWQQHLPIRLPDLIVKPDDVFGFEELESSPNFITNKTIEAKVCSIDEENLLDKIVFIENADPGYDWIFTKPIKGFVTKFGGENSHMAIRAREFSLPAVIGAGKNYDKWKCNKVIRMECELKRVEVIA